MKISFIGMSGCGKTTWSKKLEQKGFAYFGCDDYIGLKLAQKMKYQGFEGIHEVARWLGQPYEPQHQTSSKKYLDFERSSVVEILNKLECFDGKAVIDTTGSVIYLGDELMERLAETTTIVYIKVPESKKQEMFRTYMNDPKPVLWGSMFKRRPGESEMEALRRCYPLFLDFRSRQYEKYAKVTVDYARLHDGMTVNLLIKHLKNEIPKSQ